MSETKYFRVVSKRDGFRRGGIAHPDRPVFHRRADFNPAEIEAMKHDSMLIVDDMDPPEQETPAGDAPKPGKDAGGKAAS